MGNEWASSLWGVSGVKNVDEFDVKSVGEKGPIGYFFEVDLEYPDELHELHNDYPLAPEKISVSSDMLSNYCKKIADKFEIKVGGVKKLIPQLGNATNYVVHYRNLQLYFSLGMKLTNLRSLNGWKNILVVTLKKGWMLLMILKNIF